MTVVIKSHDLLPLEEGEELGMPTYRVIGTINDRLFRLDVSCEIDGRDCDFTNAFGPEDFADNFEIHGLIFEKLCDIESWVNLHQIQCDAYYNA